VAVACHCPLQNCQFLFLFSCQVCSL
jgi:hypothetical protein